MTRTKLDTAADVLRWAGMGFKDMGDLGDYETAAYIADAVTMYRQRLIDHPATTKRVLENERLRQAFDALEKLGYDSGDLLVLEVLQSVRNTMKDNNK